MRVSGPIGAVISVAAAHGIVDVVSREPNLEDVFLAQYGEHPASSGEGAPSDRQMTEVAVLDRPGPLARVLGIGSVYGKTLRDSLAAAIVVGGVAGLFMFGTGAPYGVAPDSARSSSGGSSSRG